MSYYSKGTYPEGSTYSPVDFKKSTAKVGYSTSYAKDPEIEELKEKYGVKTSRNREKYPDSYNNFSEIRKVPDEISNLRATFNAGSKFRPPFLDKFDIEDKADKADKADKSDILRRPSYKLQKEKPEISLRHTVYSKKTDREDNDFSYPVSSVSTSYTTPYRKSSDYEQYKYDPKRSQASTVLSNVQRQGQKQKGSKIDFEKINEKLKNNAAMIDELRRLKEERKTRQDNKVPKLSAKDFSQQPPSTSTYDKYNASDRKKNYTKAYDVEPYTPKYEKKPLNLEDVLTKPKSNGSTALERSKSNNYLAPEKPKHLDKSVTPEKRIEKTLSSVKSSKDLATKEVNVVVGEFVLGKNLGEGKFGIVFRAIHKPTGSIYAIKKVPKKMIRAHYLIDQFILELKIQSFFDHRNILKIFGFFDDKDSIYLILEYMEEGTLFTYFKKNKTLAEDDAAKKIRDVSEAIQCLHESGVAHRDIKPENIVMSHGVCKLCDFGWATICNQRRKTYCGTFDYAAPEILEGVEYDMTVDEWCIGILAYELMVGKAPFYHISRKETMKKIMSAEKNSIDYPETMSKKAILFIQKLIVKNPELRMTSEEILEHPFLQIEENFFN